MIRIATSDLPSMLYKYIVKHYPVPLLKAHPDSLFDSVLNHQVLLDLFCDIITFQDLCSFSSEHLKISSYLLNHIAYRVFQDENRIKMYDAAFLHKIQKALRELHAKFPNESFWIIDKKIEKDEVNA